MSECLRVCRKVALVALVVAIGWALSLPSAGAQSTLADIKANGSIRLGFANESPFGYNTPDGKLVGIDVEILQYILGQMGVKKIVGSLTTFGGLIPGLKAKRFDIVSDAIYIKPDRCAQVAFGEPEYILGDTIVVKKGNPHNIHSYKDVVAQPSFRLGYTIGATGVTDKAKAMGVKESQLVSFPDTTSGYAALKAGRIDGFAVTAVIAGTQLIKLNDPSLVLASPFAQPVINGKISYGIASFAVRKEDSDLLAQLNKYLLKFRGTPKYVAILKKYGMSQDDLPPEGTTTAKVCGS